MDERIGREEEIGKYTRSDVKFFRAGKFASPATPSQLNSSFDDTQITLVEATVHERLLVLSNLYPYQSQLSEVPCTISHQSSYSAHSPSDSSSS